VTARVLIVDDHASFRSFARRLLAADGFHVVGEASDAADAFDAVRALAPDVVLLDIRLPDLDGFGVAEVLAGDDGVYGAPHVVLVSSRARADYGGRIEGSPVRGFIAKDDLSGDSLRRVLDERGPALVPDEEPP
jgi:two-component system nitrate/nitrite response regulator NarL